MYVIQTEINEYKASLALERLCSRNVQRVLVAVLSVASIGALGGLLVSTFLNQRQYEEVFLGALYVTLGFLIATLLLRFYHNAHYYRGFRSIIGLEKRPQEGITYETARALERYTADCTQGFCRSFQGMEVLLRCGLTVAQIEEFVSSDDRILINSRSIILPRGRMFLLQDLAAVLYREDPSFQRFLEAGGVTEETFTRSVAWVTRMRYAQKQKERWWGKDNLSHTTGIGQDWSYGIAYLLNKFSKPLHQGAVFTKLAQGTGYAASFVQTIEETLARAQEANIMLVGEAGVGKMDIVLQVAERARTGESLGAVRGKHFIALDTELLLASYPQKHELEQALIVLLNQAVKAGNVVLVIDDMPAFIRGAKAIEVDVPKIMDGYLSSSEMHIIGTAVTGAYHRETEIQDSFVRRFEVMFVTPPDSQGSERLLESVVQRFENEHGVLLTYPALHMVVEGADRYITSGVMPDKAIQLLVEIMSTAGSQQEKIIRRQFIEAYIHKKTGLPVGPLDDAERDELLNLEAVLHERVVGQHRAIDAISSAIRRSRAGIQDSEKPMGTFLFIGPTGVGKTETAKALAAIFFESEENMVRFDMSEYSGEEGVGRFIGSVNEAGALSSAMKEHPYSVLLLDEFEKADVSVHDLFLQILDEGYFTDARGDRINMRNTIIIATSNAGSDAIMQVIEDGGVLYEHKDSIVDGIIAAHTYKPELINRFDSVVLFEPLGREEQKIIAGFMLADLETRIRERGYRLEVTDLLTEVVATHGYDPKFGARPMRRVIQDVVEEAVAQKIIKGAIQKGDVITLTEEDITAVL